MLFSTALAAAGLVAQGVTTGISIAQGLKNRAKAVEAQAKVTQALDKAKSYLQVNVYDKMGIAKEPFELARQASIQQASLALQAAGEGQARGAAAAAGGVQMAMMNQEAQNRASMSEEMYNLALKSAEQEQSNMEYMASLNLQEAEGAAKAQADAEKAAMQSFAGAAEGVAGMLGSAAKLGPDVIKTVEARQALNLKDSYEKALKSGNLKTQMKDAQGNPIGYEMAVIRGLGISDEEAANLPIYSVTKNAGGMGEMKVLDPVKFQVWLETLDKSQLKPLIKGGFESSAVDYNTKAYQRRIGRQLNTDNLLGLSPFNN